MFRSEIPVKLNAHGSQAFGRPQILGWRSQGFLREVEAIGHIVGSLIPCIQWLQPKRNFRELHQAYMGMKRVGDSSL